MHLMRSNRSPNALAQSIYKMNSIPIHYLHMTILKLAAISHPSSVHEAARLFCFRVLHSFESISMQSKNSRNGVLSARRTCTLARLEMRTAATAPTRVIAFAADWHGSIMCLLSVYIKLAVINYTFPKNKRPRRTASAAHRAQHRSTNYAMSSR